MSRHFNACYKCPDRHLGCHKTCERYLSEKRKYDEMRERKKKDMHVDMMLYEIEKKKR